MVSTRRFFHTLFLIFLSVFYGSSAFSQGKVRIVVSVDWEGRDLSEHNLAAMQDFRERFPTVPLQQFLNAAYYTKPQAYAADLTRSIKSVLRPGDEHGLHIHAWRSLVTAAGVRFRTGPSFVDQDVDVNWCGVDCGSDVSLTAYTKPELRKIIRKSVEILTAQGFNRPTSFRAGGWQADDTVLNALAEEGFALDSSATYAPYLEASWGAYNLYRFVAELWPTIIPNSQPYTYTSKTGHQILELPNNASLADYVTGSDMLNAFIAQARLLQASPQDDVYLSIGFHQETAAAYLPRLISALNQIHDYALMRDIPYEFVVAPF
jgi:hypothetical protein